MTNLGFLTGASGGVSYHLAAYRYRNSRWLPFRRKVESWLEEEWSPDAKELVIFGPSAGWTLDKKFLGRFSSVECVEPDPLARFLFRRRLGKHMQLGFETSSRVLPWFSPTPESFSEFLSRRPGAAILFANLLGQVPFLLPKNFPEGKKVEAAGLLARALEGRQWASYHDLFSAGECPRQDHPVLIEDPEADPASIASRFYPERAEVVDHETLWLSKGRRTWCSTWEIRPGTWHVVGFVHS